MTRHTCALLKLYTTDKLCILALRTLYNPAFMIPYIYTIPKLCILALWTLYNPAFLIPYILFPGFSIFLLFRHSTFFLYRCSSDTESSCFSDTLDSSSSDTPYSCSSDTLYSSDHTRKTRHLNHTPRFCPTWLPFCVENHEDEDDAVE